MIREPLQSCESWVRLVHSDYNLMVDRITKILLDFDNYILKKYKAIGLRLEDLKRYPRKTLPALCKWLDIKETESLYGNDCSGKKW